MFRRQSAGTCEEGKTWYHCKVNSFSGCCTVDPCDLSACPDAGAKAESASIPALVTKTTVLTVMTVGASSPPQSMTSSSPSISRLAPTISTMSSSVFNEPVVFGIATSASTISSSVPSTLSSASSSSTATPTTAPMAKPSSSRVPVIAGAISGVAGLVMVLTVLIFCLHRRRMSMKRRSLTEFGFDDKEIVPKREPSPCTWQLQPPSAVFDPFGGRHRSPTPSLANLAQTPIEDQQIKDPEKRKLAAPPISKHPAYHQVSSPPMDEYITRSLNLLTVNRASPEYHPGIEVHVPAMHSPAPSPIDVRQKKIPHYPTPKVGDNQKELSPPLPSPPMTQHPSYHISQLIQHPVFRTTPPLPSSPSYPRRTSAPRDIPIPRIHTFQPSPFLSTLGNNPVSNITRSELEAPVPVEYHSPPPLQTPISAISGAWFAPSELSTVAEPKSQPELKLEAVERQSWLPVRNHKGRKSGPVGLGLFPATTSKMVKSTPRGPSRTSKPQNFSRPQQAQIQDQAPPSPISATLRGKRNSHVMSWAADHFPISLHNDHHINQSNSKNKEVPTSSRRKDSHKEVAVTRIITSLQPHSIHKHHNSTQSITTTTPATDLSSGRWSRESGTSSRTSLSLDTNAASSHQHPTATSDLPIHFARAELESYHASAMGERSLKGKEREVPLPCVREESGAALALPSLTPLTAVSAVSDGYGEEGVSTWGSWVDR